MFGEPKDVEGECAAQLYIGDTYGDTHATMRCQLESGHEGPHKEHYNSNASGEVEITWAKDASFLCPKHGRVEQDANGGCWRCSSESE